MSTFKSFAVVGLGAVGTPVIEALVAKGVSVVLITRPGSLAASKAPKGAKTASADLKSPTSVAEVLRAHKVEVVISTVGHPGLPDQPTIAEGAKLAGVKLFSPSEYGFSTIGATHGELGVKGRFAEHLAEIGLPSVRFFVGGFISYIPWMVELDSGKFKILGKGQTRASFTAPEDISGFIAHVLTTLPPAELTNKIFNIQGVYLSFTEIAALIGREKDIEHVDSIDDDFKTALHTHIESGQGNTGGTSNHLWEGHQWKGINDVLGK